MAHRYSVNVCWVSKSLLAPPDTVCHSLTGFGESVGPPEVIWPIPFILVDSLFLRMVISPLHPQHQPTWVQHMPITWGNWGPEKERSRDQAVAELAEPGFQARDLCLVLIGRAGTVSFIVFSTPTPNLRLVCCRFPIGACWINEQVNKLNNFF